MRDDWQTVSSAEPCPACEKGDWCAWAPSGNLRCMRGGAAPRGMVRIADDADGGTIFAPDDDRRNGKARDERRHGTDASRNGRPAEPSRLDALQERFRSQATPESLRRLAESTNVSVEGWATVEAGFATAADLRELKAGFTSAKSDDGKSERYPSGAWTTPERDGEGRIVGFGLRTIDGRKGAFQGMKRGLTVPTTFRRETDGADVGGSRPVLIVEGASDVAAAHDLGFRAIGRPSARQGAAALFKLLDGAGAFVVGENDAKDDGTWPGRDGAKAVAEALASKGSVDVRWAVMPEGVKDVRRWLETRGPTSADSLCACLEQTAAAPERVGTKRKRKAAKDGAGSEADVYEFDPFGGVEITNKRRVDQTLARLTSELRRSGDCFLRAGQLVVIRPDGTVRPILSSPELSGLVAERVQVYKVQGADDDAPAPNFIPLPPAFASDWLHGSQRSSFPEVKTFTRSPVYVVEGNRFADARLIAAPGFDAASGVYYAGPIVEPRHRTDLLDALLADFCFRTVGDRSNYVGVMLTALLMQRFIGSHPAALFNGNQPGLGKSILAQILSIVRDGKTCETVSYNPNDEELEKRLGAAIRPGPGVVVVDNAKARGRNGRIDSPCLERSITDETLSFRLLGKSDSIRAENSVQFCLTANASDVSRDLITRSAIIDLRYEGDPSRRRYRIEDPEGFAAVYRIELLAELAGMIERWIALGAPLAQTDSRFNKRGWGNAVGGVLLASGFEGFLANASDAAATLDETRREFAELVGVLADSPQGTWSAAELVDLCSVEGLLRCDLGDGTARSRATKFGNIALRFVGERFTLLDGRIATFDRGEGRKGAVYRVGIESKDDDDTAEGF